MSQLTLLLVRQSVWLRLLLLFVSMQVVRAVKLNLTETCAGAQARFCTISNISISFDMPLIVVDTSHKTLEELVLRDSVLRAMPHGLLSRTPNLSGFFLYRCELNRLSTFEFEKAKQLRRLLIERNRLFTMPEEVFASMSLLEELYLGSNMIRMLHRKAFAGLQQLRYLDLQHNIIQTLSKELFAELVNLEHIDLSHNELTTFNADIFATNMKLQSVLLNDNKFVVFEPNSLEHLPHLNLLDLSNTQLDELYLQSVDQLIVYDSGLQKCTINGSAIKINAAFNNLKDIYVRDLLSVYELDLRDNLVERMDSFVGMLNLQRLQLSHNFLKSLNTTHYQAMYLLLPNLKELNLAKNSLKNLSVENFLLLKKVELLDLSYNNLGHIDESVLLPLAQLEKLYIEGNELQTFDYELFIHRHLHVKEIGLYENEWPPQFLDKMLNYLQEMGLQLPQRYSTANAIIEAIHEQYSTFKERARNDATNSSVTAAACVDGIHPYWTMRDILTMAILVGVMCILLLQLYTILREEGCLSSQCCRTIGNTRNTVTSTNRPRRLNEDDSDV